MKLIFRKNLGSLVPTDDAGQDLLRKIKHGDLVHVDVRRTRNIKFHRMYWALLNLIFDNLPEGSEFKSAEQIHNALKFAAGIYETQPGLDGSEQIVLGSTSFEDMDQTAFSSYYDKVCDILAKRFLPGVTSQQLKNEVELLIGVRTPAQAAE